MPDLPQHPSLEHLRKQAKSRKRARGSTLSRAQFEIAREYGFAGWPQLVQHVRLAALEGIERVLVQADPAALAALLSADGAAATRPVTEVEGGGGPAPLLVLLRRAIGPAQQVRECARLLLDAGADPGGHTVEWGGESRRTALFDAVERDDLALARLLVERGAVPDEDAFYHACEQSDTAFLDLLHRPGFERLVVHKLDFEDAAGLRWFLDRGADVNACRALHHAIARGRGTTILTMLLDAGADVNLPWDRWDVGRRPLALAARCGHLAAYELLSARGARAELDPVDAAVLAVARGESVRLPAAPRPHGAIRIAATSGGCSASSRCSAVPTWYGRCWTAGRRSTRGAGVTSRRWIRPPCTAGRRRCGC
ncbi:ankyrin repeat domain-containing protein [Nonomuraea sp. H19]|uniref:ankyrin repeat domain-containing protein n=1 Tax=Nonomuraea sp. H19 TaxID=3452206 RepID=UPI003F893EBB